MSDNTLAERAANSYKRGGAHPDAPVAYADPVVNPASKPGVTEAEAADVSTDGADVAPVQPHLDSAAQALVDNAKVEVDPNANVEEDEVKEPAEDEPVKPAEDDVETKNPEAPDAEAAKAPAVKPKAEGK